MKKFLGAALPFGLLLTLACESGSDPPLGPDSDLLTTASEPGSQVVASVTGSGHYGSAAVWTTYSFRAVLRANGEVDGMYQVRRHISGGGAKQHGRIVCLAIDGNQAWLGAIRENTAAVTNEGSWTGFSVVDNGERAGSPPDQIASLVRNTNDQFPAEDYARAYCANQELIPPQVLRDIEAGEIQIHRPW